MAAERFQYLELRPAIGSSTCLGFMLPSGSRRRLSVNGDDAFSFNIEATHRLVPQIEKGKIVREVLSTSGTSWREWEIKDYRLGAVLMMIECRPIMELLKAYPIHLVDGDGYVYTDAPAIQLPPATMISQRILSTTPAIFGLGTVTPTALGEVAFADDNARSGLLRMEEVFPPYNAQLRWSGTQYLIDFIQIGAGAPVLYLRDMKNLVALEKRTTQDHINRLTQIRGAPADDGPTGIAWAYWEIQAISGTAPNVLVTLKAIHGGDGPIKFDDQFNHANLPGGANSLYLETATYTYLQITDTIAATQQVKVPVTTGLTVGDRVRLCASSTGKHLTFLDAPAEIALYGVHPGGFESAFDDTHTVNKNALQAAWATPASLPDGWTGLGAQTTVAADVITAGKALLVNQSVTDGAQIAAPPAAVVKIRARQTKWCATAWIKVKTAFGTGGITFQLKANGTVVGTGLLYGAPATYTVGVYRQLILRGLDLSAFVGTSPSLVAEIVKSGGTGTVHMAIDDICITASVGERAAGEGSNDARTWQEANRFLDAERAAYLQWPVTDADLARNGITAEAGATLGGTVVMETERYGTVSARILAITDVPEDPAQGAQYEVSTRPARFSREQVKPAALIIPFGVPQEVTTANVGEANAALICKVITPFSQTATQITVNLSVADTRGGAPTVTGVALGGATIASGSGAGPWVINKPAAGVGVGRVVFTASLPGRTDVWDAVDVPEQVAAALVYNEVRTAITGVTATTVSVTVTAVAPSGTPTVQLVSVGGSASLNTGPAIGVPSASGQVWVFNRGAFQTGLGDAVFRAVFAGNVSDDDAVVIADQGRDTVAVTGRCRVLSSTDTQVVVRTAMSDPFPQGAASGLISYQLSPAVTVISPAISTNVTPAATITEAAGTYVDWTIDRPLLGAGAGRVTFTFAAAISANRISDTDSIDVPEQLRPALAARATLVSTTATQMVVNVAVVDPDPPGGASVTVNWNSGALTVTPASGGTLAPTTDFATTGAIAYTITRPAFGTGAGIVAFTATATGRNPASVSVDVPEVGRDTIGLSARLKLVTINATTVVVRVAVADPIPPGGATVTVTYTLDTAGGVTPASGGTLTPTADLATTGTIDYTVDRPGANAPARRFTATATATGRTPAADAIDVPPQDPPALDLKSEWVSDTQWKLTWVATGTVEVSLNGAAYAAPGVTSGVAFTRPAYGAKDDVHAFRVTSGGLVISNTITVPAQVVLSPVLTLSLPAVGAGSTVDFAWTFSGMPSGVTFAASYTAFNSAGALTGAAGQATGLTASPWNQTPSPARATGDYYTVVITAEYQGKTLATRTRTGLLT